MELPVTIFRRGAVVSWPADRDGPGPALPRQIGTFDDGDGPGPVWWEGRWPGDPVRMTATSRRFVGFTLANADVEWRAMATLTWDRDVSPDEATGAVKAWRKRLWSMGLGTFSWIREHHRSGRPHYHWFLGRAPGSVDPVEGETLRRVVRRGKATDVLSGPLGLALEDAWLRIATPSNPGFVRGGLTELLRCPEAAGRYVAKEAGKAAQKVAGPEWAGRRWWGRSSDVVALPVATARLTDWPAGVPPLRIVWDVSLLDGFLPDQLTAVASGKDCHPGTGNVASSRPHTPRSSKDRLQSAE